MTGLKENNNNDNNNNIALSLTTASEVNDVSYRAEQEVLVMLTLKAPYFKPDKKRAPVSLSAVIDISGSMRDNSKLDLVKKATIFVANQLNENDHMSVVAYREYATVPFGISKMTSENKERLERVVKSMKADGGTNIADGLRHGIQQLESLGTTDNNTVSSTLLFTDGQANQGPTTAGQIYSVGRRRPSLSMYNPWRYWNWIRSWIYEENPANFSTINTFGFGGDHNAAMLNELARLGEGSYFYIKNTSDIGTSFANCLGGLTSVFAQKIKVRAEGLHGCTITENFTKYKQIKDRNGSWNEIEMQDVQSQEQKDLIFRIKVPAIKNSSKEFEAIRFAVNYFNVLTKEIENQTITLSLKRSELPEPQTRPSELDIEYNRVAVAKALDEATLHADSGRLDEAKVILEGAMELLKSSITSEDPKNKGLKEDLEKSIATMRNQHSYMSGGQQMIQTNANSHWQQRQTSTSHKGQERYSTSHKTSMMGRFF
eukprot:TRINITY_DN646_c0_g1_i1.p1 TRINITY_DN646_c0_g1~~TRINITY_DN646_c0_g1_i1.p1  ORF type:complete len:486 (-),score=130.95 TRINITY_DN646_c0_g1_i1:75-1532(-)